MPHYPDMDDEEEWEEETPARRQRGPRFGPFVTIAAAILILFGAASRLGKPQIGNGLFSIDLSATTRLDQERERLEDERRRTIVFLGPAPVDTPPPPRTGQRAVPTGQPPYRDNPYRPEPAVEYYAPPLDMRLPMGESLENYQNSGNFDPAPEAMPGTTPSVTTYTVVGGDTWVKIAKATGKRWQDIQKANPASQNGLRVGMKLVIP